jgi:Na+-transporting methylmalonyl-CoA/oxaloacetate decarboxylase gamma subunit
MGNLTNALWITAVGMGLVFAVILLLWGLIILIVRLGARVSRREAVGLDVEMQNKQRAAAVAVAAALAFAVMEHSLGEEQHTFPLPPTAVVSPWQSVTRSKILNKRGRVR